MRILYIAFDDLSRDFAWTVHIREVVTGLAKQGHSVDLVAVGKKKPDWLEGEWHPLPRPATRAGRILHHLVGSVGDLRGAAHGFRPDMIYYRGIHLAPSPLLVAKSMGVPLVVEVNGWLESETPARLRWAVKWTHELFLSEAAHTVTVSDRLKKGLCERYGADPNKVSVVPNGATPRETPPPTPGEARKKLGLPERPTLVYVGSFYPHHALDLLPEVMDRLPGFQVVLAGDGMTRHEIEKRLDPGRARFLGSVPHEDIPGILAAGDIGLYFLRKPHEHFGFSPIKLYEYMAAGLPVVAGTDLPEIGGFVREHDIGLSTRLSAEEFAAEVESLWRDEPARREMGRKGMKKIREEFSWAHTAKSVGDILHRHALSGAPTPRVS